MRITYQQYVLILVACLISASPWILTFTLFDHHGLKTIAYTLLGLAVSLPAAQRLQRYAMRLPPLQEPPLPDGEDGSTTLIYKHYVAGVVFLALMVMSALVPFAVLRVHGLKFVACTLAVIAVLSPLTYRLYRDTIS